MWWNNNSQDVKYQRFELLFGPGPVEVWQTQNMISDIYLPTAVYFGLKPDSKDLFWEKEETYIVKPSLWSLRKISVIHAFLLFHCQFSFSHGFCASKLPLTTSIWCRDPCLLSDKCKQKEVKRYSFLLRKPRDDHILWLALTCIDHSGDKAF